MRHERRRLTHGLWPPSFALRANNYYVTSFCERELRIDSKAGPDKGVFLLGDPVCGKGKHKATRRDKLIAGGFRANAKSNDRVSKVGGTNSSRWFLLGVFKLSKKGPYFQVGVLLVPF